ncbi:glycosyltransferase family 2 protein [Peloplasma aerotolerans]|uniref:Glycosyltransferase family 2 protein n=1 Tax=Peloplasma aerotolerans TaxID=3044389 RepID=A0AAW6U5J4_9MOLU|nr:glycosyltransferase family 2 protein [Mariniplasma sp. M4Ah]MDI6453246.1 glycosyltransferase family 2 protein [Mariniplasma sp. M4Ah]
MKTISFVIPSYNSEKYLHTAIESLFGFGDDIEIIIVNDGSKDQTLHIAKSYQKAHPHLIEVVDQQNGGHGSGINAGLKIAKGTYFKVLDSDDWMDRTSLEQLLSQMRKHSKENKQVDLYITNFVYEHVEDQTQYERDYFDNFPAYKIFRWDQIKKNFRYSKTLLMHALIYRTDILREIGLELPRHTFYVDNIVAYVPLPYVKTIYYMPLPLYRYFIGRMDQSVTLENITKRYQQQIKVFKILNQAYTYEQLTMMEKGLKQYMKHCIAAMLIITQMFTVASDSDERRMDLSNLWEHIKNNDKKMYRYLRYRSYNTTVNFFPWKIKSFLMVRGYLYLAKKVKLG